MYTNVLRTAQRLVSNERVCDCRALAGAEGRCGAAARTLLGVTGVHVADPHSVLRNSEPHRRGPGRGGAGPCEAPTECQVAHQQGIHAGEIVQDQRRTKRVLGEPLRFALVNVQYPNVPCALHYALCTVRTAYCVLCTLYFDKSWPVV